MTNRRFIAAFLIGSLGLPALIATAEPPDKVMASAGDQAQVMDILREADAATRAVKAVTYEGEMYGLGAMKDRVPHIKGTIKAKQGKRSLIGVLAGSSSSTQMIRFEGTVAPAGSTEETPLKIASDGKQAFRIDEKARLFIHGTLPEALDLLSPAINGIYMREYLFPTPFADELAGKVVRYEGVKEVGGVECDVVYVVYQNDTESRWYFGKKDHLPRRVDRVFNIQKRSSGETMSGGRSSGKTEDAYVIEIKSLDISPAFEAGEFRLKRPSGYEAKKYEPPKWGKQPGLLEVGSEAPDWQLSTPDGQKVSLKSLRGQVVVMDFWATWCGPCKLAMPGVQKLHEQFEDQPVKVFGISTWERGGDPTEYMKEKEFTYTLLVKGDKVAELYRVNNIPTMYVVGPDGKILYAYSGVDPDKQQQDESLAKVAQIIKKSIKKAGGE